jgi:tRNA(adenine34) deaminase
VPHHASSDLDRHWMHHALALAKRAQAAGEIPVGAVIVAGADNIGEGWNACVGSNDPTAHAEIVAIRHAGLRLENYRISDATMYVTLEPCAMCAGAIVQARLERIVFGAHDPKAGAAGSVLDVLGNPRLNHRAQVLGGVEAEACGRLLTEFFKARRAAAGSA